MQGDEQFISITKTTLLRSCPLTLCQIVLSKKYLTIEKPHKDFNFQGDFKFSQILTEKSSMTIHVIKIHRFNREQTRICNRTG